MPTFVAPALRQLRSLEANGHPLAGLINDIGIDPATAWLHDHDAAVPAAHTLAVRYLYDELGDRPGPCDDARARARADGFHPPAAYEGEYLDLRAVPGHPWTLLDDAAALVLLIAREILDGRGSTREIATRLGAQYHAVRRVAARMDLAPGSPREERADAVARYGPDLAHWEQGSLDTVHAALRLGLCPRPTAAQAEHPGVIIWELEFAARETEERAA